MGLQPQVYGSWRVLLQLRAVGQADPFPGKGRQLAPGRIGEVVGQQEEVGGIDVAPSVEVEAGVAAAGRLLQRGRSRFSPDSPSPSKSGVISAVAVKVTGSRPVTDTERGVDSGQAQSEGGGSAAVLIGCGRGGREGPFAHGHREGDGGPVKLGPWCVSLKWGVSRSVL